MAWVRKCQECGNIQRAQKPPQDKPLSDSYRMSKCRRCKSEALDYGKERPDTPTDKREE